MFKRSAKASPPIVEQQAPLPSSDELTLDAEFRRSLLGVLVVDIVVLFAWLGWSRRASSLALLAIASVLAPVALALVRRPALRRTVMLFARREKGRRAVIVPVAVSVVLASLGLRLGERAANLASASSAHHLGRIDEVVLSPNAQARNEALDALTRAKQNDARVKAVIDDAIPFASADGALRSASASLAVTVVELDLSVMREFGKFVPQSNDQRPTTQETSAALNAGEVGVGADLLAKVGGSAELSIAGESGPSTLRVVTIPTIDTLDLFGDGNASLGELPRKPIVYVAPGAVTTAAARVNDRGLSANVRFGLAISNIGDADSGRKKSDASVSLLQSIFASPPAGPEVAPEEDPLGLGGESVIVAAPIDATVLAVKDQHERRIQNEFSQAKTSLRLARAGLFGAAIGVVVLSHLMRRRKRAERSRALRILGLGGRSALLTSTAFEAVSVMVGLVLGALTALGIAKSVGPLSALDRSPLRDRTNLARAVTFSGLLAALPMLIVLGLLLLPRGLRRRLPSFHVRRVPASMVPILGVVGLVFGGFLTFRRTTETTLVLGVFLLAAGGAALLGSTVFRSPAFGVVRTRPALGMKMRAFALASAASCAVLLPVVASQSVSSASSVGNGGYRSVVTLDDTADAAGALGQLVTSVGGRVVQRTSLMVEGGRIPQASTIASITSAADALDGSWIPGPHQSVDTPGTVVVSRRFASSHPGGVSVGDHLVLRDGSSGRSVEVSVVDVVKLAPWAGDIATSDASIAPLRPTKEVLRMRSAVALTPSRGSAITDALAIVAPNAPARILPTAELSPLNLAMTRWLRRAGVATFGLLALVALMLRSGQWERVSPKIVGLATLFGIGAALLANGKPVLTPWSPWIWVGGAALACVVASTMGVATTGLVGRLAGRAAKVKPERVKVAKPTKAKAEKPEKKQAKAKQEKLVVAKPDDEQKVTEVKPAKAAKAKKPKPVKSSKRVAGNSKGAPEGWTIAEGWTLEE